MVISCVPVFTEDQVTAADISTYSKIDNDVIINEEGKTEMVNKADVVHYKWRSVIRLMNMNIPKGYNLYNHNCCTTAYNVAKILDPKFITKKEADPMSFNFGMGVVWSLPGVVADSLWSSSVALSQISAADISGTVINAGNSIVEDAIVEQQAKEQVDPGIDEDEASNNCDNEICTQID